MKPRLRKAARFLERTLAIAGALFIVYHAFFEVSQVTTSSMAPLLLGADRGEADWIFIERCFTRARVPRRFQVVSFLEPEGTVVAKRVVGFPGETIQILHDRTLLIDGVKVQPPAGVGDGRGYLGAGRLFDGKPFKVPDGEVFVLGDDTKDSYDGRYMGGLPIDRIRGRVILRVAPLSRWKWLS